MALSMSLVMAVQAVNPPAGGVSPLAWVIIGALVVALLGVCSFGKYWTDRMYKDLKECNEKRLDSEEDILGVLKVLRISMEQSRGGKAR
jgi:hypothetical protein